MREGHLETLCPLAGPTPQQQQPLTPFSYGSIVQGLIWAADLHAHTVLTFHVVSARGNGLWTATETCKACAA
eukprot:m51a1_g6959 hypothetical protein (72) ;mRNA; f:74755-74970